MRGSVRSKALALLGSAAVLGALLVAAPSVRATAVIDTINLAPNKPWSLATDSSAVYVGLYQTTQPEVLKVNPNDGSFQSLQMPSLGGSRTWVARGSATGATGKWLYASSRDENPFPMTGLVTRVDVVANTFDDSEPFPFAVSDIAVQSTNGVDDTLYVGADRGVLILDAVSLRWDDTIPLPLAQYSRDIAIVGDDSIVVTRETQGSVADVYIINTRTDDSIPVPIYDPRGVAISPDNQWAYVTSVSTTPGQPFLYKLSTRTGSVDDTLTEVEVPGGDAAVGYEVAVAPDGTVYVTAGGQGGFSATRVVVLPQGSFAEATSLVLPTPPGGGLAVAPNGRAYVGGGGTGQLQVLGSLAPPPDPSPTPATPPGAPTDVVAKGGWKSVTVDWSAPANQGSFPITTYLVKASPGGQLCLARRSDANPTRCTFTSLTAGTQYTFRVQALNGGGWGAESAPSNSASPSDLRITSQQRKKLSFLGIPLGSEVRAGGSAFGFPARTQLGVWIKEGNTGQWVQQTGARLTTDNAGRFSWSRNFSRNKDATPIWVRFSVGSNFSNEVVLPVVR